MFSKLILPITSRCNLDCKYCYVDKRGSKSLPFLLAKKAINYLISNNKNKKVSLIFTGGEPLLEWKKMQKLIIFAIYTAKKRDARLETVGFSTNGLLLDENILRFCRKKNVKVAVSIDGFYNMRKTYGGKNSFIILKKKFPLFVKYQDVLRARMTVVSEHAGKLFYNFKNLLKEGFLNIDIQPAIGLFWPRKFQSLYLKNFKKSLEEIKERERKKGEKFFVKHLQDFAAGRRDKHCAKGWQTVLIDLDGTFYPCDFFLAIPLGERKKYTIGNISQGLNYNLAKSYRNYKICQIVPMSPSRKKMCLSCRVSKVCFKICLGFDSQKSKFNLEVAQNNWQLFRDIEKIYNKYQQLVNLDSNF